MSDNTSNQLSAAQAALAADEIGMAQRQGTEEGPPRTDGAVPLGEAA
ncbi:hypothetical protein ACFQOZ_07680 [Comamonas endophytica]